MNRQEVMAIVAECKFPDFHFEVITIDSVNYIRGVYYEADTQTGQRERQQTRYWIVETTASRSEIVATCFKCIMTSMEHRTRERFTYRNRAIYQPHHDVDKLLEICEERIRAV